MAKNTEKGPIKVRRKTLKDGNVSLYLDIYRNGQREYEFLKLYLIPEKTKQDREQNKQTLQLANAIKAQRLLEMQNGEYGFKTLTADKILFFDFYQAQAEKRRQTGSASNYESWLTTLRHLRAYEKNGRITLAQITSAWVEGFKDYLDTKARTWEFDCRVRKGPPRPLADNSKAGYFRKLRACMNAALKTGLISVSPFVGVEDFKRTEGTRMYLTLEEVIKLANTECDYPEVKRAFLFSCLTGLRRSDILKMTWSEVQHQGTFTRIIFRQKKTGGQEYLDVSEQAAALMGERGKPTDHVFGLLSPSACNNNIRVWVARAGIDKYITFHSGRHTFAVMMLDLGVDIYTTSKLLGHRELSTTQIYAKVLDKNKQAAVQRIPNIFQIPTDKI